MVGTYLSAWVFCDLCLVVWRHLQSMKSMRGLARIRSAKKEDQKVGRGVTAYQDGRGGGKLNTRSPETKNHRCRRRRRRIGRRASRAEGEKLRFQYWVRHSKKTGQVVCNCGNLLFRLRGGTPGLGGRHPPPSRRTHKMI